MLYENRAAGGSVCLWLLFEDEKAKEEEENANATICL